MRIVDIKFKNFAGMQVPDKLIVRQPSPVAVGEICDVVASDSKWKCEVIDVANDAGEYHVTYKVLAPGD